MTTELRDLRPGDTIRCDDGQLVIAQPTKFKRWKTDADGNTVEDTTPEHRRFKMVAYTGGKLHMPMLRYPVVVDLKGLKSKQKRPVFYMHKAEVILGHTEAVTISASHVSSEGVFSGADPAVSEIIRMGDAGFPWQTSIQAQLLRIEMLQDGATTMVNDAVIMGPCYIARESLLREITVAPIGVDDDTKLMIGASVQSNGVSEMTKSSTVTTTVTGAGEASPGQTIAAANTDPATNTLTPGTTISAAGVTDPIEAYRQQQAAESDRIAAIRNICANYANPSYSENRGGSVIQTPLESYAIRANWTPDQTELHALRASRPQQSIGAPAAHIYGNDLPTEMVLEAALTMAAPQRLGTQLEKHFPEQTLDSAEKQFGQHGINLQQLIITCAMLGGYTAHAFKLTQENTPKLIKAAFSSNALQSVLSNVANRFIVAGFKSVTAAWRKIAKVRPVDDFRLIESFRYNGDAEFELVPPTGQIPSAVASEAKYSNRARHYAKMITMDFETLTNADPQTLQEMSFALGRGGHRAFQKVFWSRFLAANFFTTARGNYISGANTVLGIEGLGLAAAALKNMKDENGVPMDTEGAILLTAPGLAPTARSLYNSTTVVTGKNATEAAGNPYAGLYEPVDTAYLTDPLSWYLLANPQDIAVIEACFLNGQEEPVISDAETMPGNSGIILSGMFNFGVSQQEFRGGVQSKGAA